MSTPPRRRARMGRPPKPPGEKQSRPVFAYLTPGEHDRLASAAGDASQADYVRRAILAALPDENESPTKEDKP